ncbi:MBL fold metallo-hydrolase [Luminiphilus sp. nBUS_07]|uniref:MBL fold metallo-hydrolase n=1 Tax=Luminiphilus sp. nBUS_07 TaxID=3395314 RepID=UPI003EBA6707
MKAISIVVVALLVLTSIIIYQRANILIYSMTSTELPQLLDPRDEGEAAVWFDDYYTIHKIDERTFAIGETRYYQLNFNYLILGDSRAVVFDAGTGQRDIGEVVASLTDLPITFIPSHLHYDHIGNDVVFDRTALVDLPHLRARAENSKLQLTRFEHLGEVEGYSLPELTVSEWLAPNEAIDLGGRSLRVLYTPGHTQDSISLLDREAGYLFAGDFLYPGQLYGFLPNSNMGDYLQGTQTIESVSGMNLRVFGAHRDDALGVPELTFETIVQLQDALDAIQSGTLKSNGIYPVSYTVSERVQLLAEPKWLQKWKPTYPELNMNKKAD